MAGSLFVGPDAEAHHAAIIEHEAKLERVMDAATEDARAAVAQLLAVERDFGQRRVVAAGELAVINASSGDDLLDATLAGNGKAKAQSITAAIARLRAELETIDHATEAARAKRRKAILSVFQARAKALRS